MIGYVCKYAPLEIFEAMGTETGRIQPQVTNFNQADTLMHPNVCSFAKAVLEEVMGNDVYEGLVLTTCCDSMRRLYDNLKEQFPNKFIYICDVPRKVTGLSVKVYEKSLRRMIAAYEEFIMRRRCFLTSPAPASSGNWEQKRSRFFSPMRSLF